VYVFVYIGTQGRKWFKISRCLLDDYLYGIQTPN